ncbi:hypothetical protein ABIE65_005564, partial [Constrictibacter sp. MBR-5]
VIGATGVVGFAIAGPLAVAGRNATGRAGAGRHEGRLRLNRHRS